MTVVNGKELCSSNMCRCSAQFLVWFATGPLAEQRKPCSKHLARAVRDIAKAGREAVRSRVVVFVKPLGGGA